MRPLRYPLPPVLRRRSPVRTLIVIVNYRTPDLTVGALESLADQVGPLDARVVVVDGCSGDGSAERLRGEVAQRSWGNWVSVVPLTVNKGFAYGNNAAIGPALRERTPPEYILLLNPDTVVRPGGLGAMLAFMQGNPRAGIVGPRLEEADGTAQRSAFRFHSALGEFENAVRFGPASAILKPWVVAPPVRSEPHRADWVSGACMLVRTKVFEQIGLLDDKYFMYFEETDFCLRARRRGWECWHVPRARVVHLVSQASGGKPLPVYWYESRRRYFVKNKGRVRAAVADAAWAIGHLLWRLRRAVQRREEPNPPRALADFLRHSVFGAGFRIEGR
jgi:N-acetylglucosaminyl-diphospho-decaprenol L-rhamnosyltransferase